jgi:hypothetical protein
MITMATMRDAVFDAIHTLKSGIIQAMATRHIALQQAVIYTMAFFSEHRLTGSIHLLSAKRAQHKKMFAAVEENRRQQACCICSSVGYI